MSTIMRQGSMAGIVCDAFNPTPSTFIRFTGWDSQAKKVVIAGRGEPTIEDFERHVSRSSRAGPGAIGVSPVAVGRDGAGRLTASFAALDMDASDIQQAAAAVSQLGEHGIPCFLTTGTTGRGAHVYVLFEAPVDLKLAHAFARAAGSLTTRHGTTAERFPSSARGVGKRILLPYRACVDDEFGANPLIVPGEATRIPVTALGYLDRATTSMISSFVREFTPADEPRPTPTWAPPDDLAPFDLRAEEQRLAEHWLPGRRQHLALGLAAACAKSGVPEKAAIASVTRLERAANREPEIALRRAAVRQTYLRHAEGAAIAVREHYQHAGVTPPALARGSQGVTGSLQFIEAPRLHRLGRAAGTTTRVLDALQLLARRHGRRVEEGVLVSVAHRQLAELAGVADSTVNRALQRLRDLGVITNDCRARHTSWHSSGFVLRVAAGLAGPPPPGQQFSKPPQAPGGQYECTEFSLHPAFISRGLGPAAGAVASALAAHGPLRVAMLAEATDLDPQAVRRALRRLSREAITVREGADTYGLAPDHEAHLWAVADRYGASARRERQQHRHAEQRRAYRQAVKPTARREVAAPGNGKSS